jgi:hypothetical protein
MENETSFLSTTLFFLLYTVIAQNVAINNDQLFPNPNALLYLKSGNKGIPIPRMDSAARKEIANTKGLLVYDTTITLFGLIPAIAGKTWQLSPAQAG